MALQVTMALPAMLVHAQACAHTGSGVGGGLGALARGSIHKLLTPKNQGHLSQVAEKGRE